MRAAQRNAKIAQAKARRPWMRAVTRVHRFGRRTDEYREVKGNRHFGDGPLRLCVGEAQVDPPPAITPKYERRKARQRAQREREQKKPSA